MKSTRYPLTLIILAAIVSLPVAPLTANAQDPQAAGQVSAVMRGYRTGYSDGYQAGISDAARSATRDYRNKAEYDRADRAYNAAWGSLEEYRDGYRQGFEVGYSQGYERKPFDSTIPSDLKPRTEESTVQYPTDQNKTPGQTSSDPQTNGFVIPRDTIMRVELLNNIATDISQKGDPFQARVLDPKQYDGAIVAGHISQVKRPGKAKGTAELQLSFEEIKFPNGSAAKFSAQIIEVIPDGSSEGVGKVDDEGGVRGQSSTKRDAGKIGGAAGIGAIIGLIAGGGSGAAIGATIGAGVGTAGVLTQRGKEIRLTAGQHMRIRTAGDAEVQ